MLRKDIEAFMRAKGMKNIVLIMKENDPLGKLCILKTDALMDYTDHRVDRKADIWGWLKFENGVGTRVAF